MTTSITWRGWTRPPGRAAKLQAGAAFAKKIGYPSTWRNYDALHIDRADYLGNVFRARAFEAKRDLFEKIGKPVDRSEWAMTPATINAQYSPDFNDITFPRRHPLQRPVLSRLSQARATNFGGIGVVMGHEITHGFDDEGAKFDADGSRRDWWTPASSSEFDKRIACVAAQYDGYAPYADKHVDGHLTLGENIADLGGVKISLASLRREEGASAAPAAGGYSSAQQFFYGYAQSWCQNQREERQRMLLTVDPHSPPRYRVSVRARTRPSSPRRSRCSAGNKMVNATRCEVW